MPVWGTAASLPAMRAREASPPLQGRMLGSSLKMTMHRGTCPLPSSVSDLWPLPLTSRVRYLALFMVPSFHLAPSVFKLIIWFCGQGRNQDPTRQSFSLIADSGLSPCIITQTVSRKLSIFVLQPPSHSSRIQKDDGYLISYHCVRSSYHHQHYFIPSLSILLCSRMSLSFCSDRRLRSNPCPFEYPALCRLLCT